MKKGSATNTSLGNNLLLEDGINFKTLQMYGNNMRKTS